MRTRKGRENTKLSFWWKSKDFPSDLSRSEGGRETTFIWILLPSFPQLILWWYAKKRGINWKDSNQREKKRHGIIHKKTNITSNEGKLTVIYKVTILHISKLKCNTLSFNNLWIYYLEKNCCLLLSWIKFGHIFCYISNIPSHLWSQETVKCTLKADTQPWSAKSYFII